MINLRYNVPFWSCVAICTSIGVTWHNGIVNGTIAFTRSRWSHWGTPCCFWSSDTTGTGFLHHMMPTVLSMAPLYLLGQDAWNEMQYYFFGHVIPLAVVSASHDADNIMDVNIVFIKLIQSKWGATQLCCHVTPLLLMLATSDTNTIITAPLHSLVQDDRNNWQHVFDHITPMLLMLASFDPYTIISGTTIFVRSRQSEQGVTWFFLQCDHFGIRIRITWYRWHLQWYHCLC